MCNPENVLRNAEIIRLRKSGMFPTDIAKKLGITRNTVIGVCWRAGVVKHDQADAQRGHLNPARGSKHGLAKLTEEQVAKIRRLRSILTYRELAERFGISQGQVCQIVSGKAWRHVA